MPRTILHVITTLEPDGAQTQLLQLARRLHGGRFSQRIAFLCRKTAASGVPVHDLSLRGRIDPLVVLRIARLIRAHDVDLVHTHLVHAGIAGKLAARMCRVPFVTTRHYASEEKEGTFLYRLEDRLTRGCAGVIAVSESVRRHLIDRGIAPQERISVIPNGVDTDLFDPSRFAADHAPRREGPVIGSIGRLRPQKGHEVLIAAAPAMLERFPSAAIEIVGEGPLRSDLEERARRLGVAGRVRFRGSIPHEQIPAVLAGWDLLAMPSRWEGFGIAAAEAMAMGTPVVATAVEGIAELVIDGRTGILVPAGQPEPLADAMIRLLTDAAARDEMGREGRRRVCDSFSIEAAAARLMDLYDSILT